MNKDLLALLFCVTVLLALLLTFGIKLVAHYYPRYKEHRRITNLRNNHRKALKAKHNKQGSTNGK